MLRNTSRKVDNLYITSVIYELKEIPIPRDNADWPLLLHCKSCHHIICLVIIYSDHGNTEFIKKVEQNWNLRRERFWLFFLIAFFLQTVSLVIRKEIDSPRRAPIPLDASNDSIRRIHADKSRSHIEITAYCIYRHTGWREKSVRHSVVGAIPERGAI